MRYIPIFKIFTAIIFITFAACSGGGGGSNGGATSGQAPKSYQCVPLPDGNIDWTLEVCGPLKNGATVDIRQTTQGDVPVGSLTKSMATTTAPSTSGFKKEAIGSRPLYKGKVTFTVSNLDYRSFPFPVDDIVILLFMAENDDNYEVNWHLLGNRFEQDSRIQTKLVSQRHDNICIPTKVQFCEKKYVAYDAPLYVGTNTYRFDCSWDVTVESGLPAYGGGPGIKDGLVTCGVYDVTDPKKPSLIETYAVPTSGPNYEHLNYFSAGGNSGGLVEKTNVPTTLTNFRFTIFKQ